MKKESDTERDRRAQERAAKETPVKPKTPKRKADLRAAEEPRAEGRAAEEPRAAELVRKHTFHVKDTDYVVDYRKIIVLPAINPWFSDKIAFFQTTGTSNRMFSYLGGTYLPTLGVCRFDEEVPFMGKLEGKGDVIVKTGLFKSLFVGYNYSMKMETTIPQWINQLLTEYCETYYEELIGVDFEDPNLINEGNFDKFSKIEGTLIEIQNLFDILSTYFTAEWQVALSIALCKFTGEGVWLKKFEKFVTLLDSKYDYKVTGYKGDVKATPGSTRDFLNAHGAQSSLQFSKEDGVPMDEITRQKYYLFTGRCMRGLEIGLRQYETLLRLKKRGGTKRKRLLKTRRQKKG
jgi:hypothetical protein